jgi:hypothetical protein
MEMVDEVGRRGGQRAIGSDFDLNAGMIRP